MSSDSCPICEMDAEGVNLSSGVEVECPRCGVYRVTYSLHDMLSGEYLEDERHILSGLARFASDREEPLRLHTQNVEQLIAEATPPTTPDERADFFLRVLAKRADPQTSIMVVDCDNDMSLCYSPSREDFEGILEDLETRGFVQTDDDGDEREVKLTVAGWRAAKGEEARTTPKPQAFVAMSFSRDDILEQAYEQAFRPALRRCGYRVFRSAKPHPDKTIDAEILEEIGKSAIMLADLTEHRPAVLFEAGYARGLGRKVIYTCHRQDHDECCLDIKHYWREPWDEDDLDSLADRLVEYMQEHGLEAKPE